MKRGNSKTPFRPVYIILVIIIALLVVSFLILKPFLASIISAFIIAYIFYPMYKWMKKYVKRSWFAAFISTVIIMLIVAIPLALMINSAASSIQSISKVQSFLEEGFTSRECGTDENALCNVLNQGIAKYQEEPRIKLAVDQSLTKLSVGILEYSTNAALAIPRMLLALFVTLFMIFYLFEDGPKLVDYFKQAIPLQNKHKKSLIKKFNDVTFAVIYGNFITAIVQGLLAGVGYALFGFKPLLLITLLTIFAAMIPFVGPPLVWVPLVAFKLLEGFGTNNSQLIWQGVGFIIYGIIIVGTVDNIIRPKLIGRRGDVHPVIVLIGVLGGIALFGPIGLVVGPLVLALTETMIEIFRKEHT